MKLKAFGHHQHGQCQPPHGCHHCCEEHDFSLLTGNSFRGTVGIINMANINLHMAVIIAVRNMINLCLQATFLEGVCVAIINMALQTYTWLSSLLLATWFISAYRQLVWRACGHHQHGQHQPPPGCHHCCEEHDSTWFSVRVSHSKQSKDNMPQESGSAEPPASKWM